MKKNRYSWIFLISAFFFSLTLSVPQGSPVNAYAEDLNEEQTGLYDDFGDEGEDDQFFDTEGLTRTATDIGSQKTIDFLTGFLKEDIAYSYALPSPRLSNVKTTLNLSFDKKVSERFRVHVSGNAFYDLAYRIEGRNDFSDETLDDLEYETELRDTFVEGIILPGLSFKAGKQVAAWGESDFFRVNDRVNPRDQQEPGMVELEDARLPVFASQLTYTMANFSMNIMAVHEGVQDKTAPAGSDFDYFKSARSDSLIIKKNKEPDISFKKSDYHLKLTGIFNGGDISLYASDTHEHLPYMDFYTVNPMQGVLTLVPNYKKIKSSGIAATFVKQNVIYKFEAAYLQNTAVQRNDSLVQLQLNPLSPPVTWSEKDTLISMAGFDYTGISDLRITVEGYLETIRGYTSNLIPEKHSGIIYASAVYETFNATLDHTLTAIFITETNDTILKFMSTYELTDGVSVEGGIVVYEMSDEESPYYPYRNNDRFFAGIKYSF